jgi:hypothetical protein
VKRHRFLREALEEYEDAIAYYEKLRPGLGASFILDFDQAIAMTLEFPETARPSTARRQIWASSVASSSASGSRSTTCLLTTRL